VISGYSSSSEGYRYEKKQGMRDPEMIRVGGEQDVPKGASMHRFIWNMEYPGPVVPDTSVVQRDEDRANYGGPEDNGPLAPPGTYRARLIVGGDPVGTSSFELMIDPRVQEDGTTVANLQEQHELNLEIHDALSRAYALATEVVQARKRVQSAEGEHSSLLTSLSALKDSLFTKLEPVSYRSRCFSISSATSTG